MKTSPENYTFSPDSPLWTINRELVLLLAGAKAAILQAAYPEVAHGVAAHSDFKKDSFGRLMRTLLAVYDVTFGTREEAARMAARVHAAHTKVRGEHPKAYNAFSPPAQMWVLATLIIPGFEMYERFVGRVPAEMLPVYYRDMRTFGRFFGLSPDYGPQNWNDLRTYYDEMLAGNELASDPISIELAQAIVRPSGPLAFRLATRPLRFLASELLDSALREKLGFRSKVSGRLALRALDSLLPKILPLLPHRLRLAPKYLEAQRKLRGL